MTISGASAAAVFYGVMTVDQVLLGDVCSSNRKEMTPISIDDAPRFGYRALMLDPARHFLPIEDVSSTSIRWYATNIMCFNFT